MIRVQLPTHLRVMADIGYEIEIEIEGPATQRAVLDALEKRYPMLGGTMREYSTGLRRPYMRFFACQEDISHESPDEPLPVAVANGQEPFLILGAISGGR